MEQFRLIGDFKDKYGNPSQNSVIGVMIPRSLYTKINWQNTYPHDLGRLISDGEDGATVVVHPVYGAAWLRWLANK